MEVRDLIEELKRMDPYAKVVLSYTYTVDYRTRDGKQFGKSNADRVVLKGSEVVIEGI